ncbi:thermonuclease family protein [Actinomycetospora sp. C-140]
MSAKGLFAGAVVVIAVVGGCNASHDDARTSAASSPAASSPAAVPVTAPTSSSSSSGWSAPSAAGASPVTTASHVARVIDGDSFALDNGDEVRVLGIDSCEMSTDEGDDAKSAAEGFLTGAQVTLTAEPGVDRDRYGRMLRYVSTTYGSDMGEYMVTGSHTAVYEGHNDASASRLARLRSLDTGGRTCDEPDYTPAPDPVYVPDTSDDDGTYVPSPGRRHTGNTGHPCLPGERDGDNDGYCGEGR